LKDSCDLCRHAPENLPLGIHNTPALLDVHLAVHASIRKTNWKKPGYPGLLPEMTVQ
jgi:hypothetical protein